MAIIALILYAVGTAAFAAALFKVRSTVQWVALGLLAWILAHGLIPSLDRVLS